MLELLISYLHYRNTQLNLLSDYCNLQFFFSNSLFEVEEISVGII